MHSRTKPAVVIMSSMGCSLAVMDCFMTSYKLRSLMAWSSSMMIQCELRPSRLFDSLASGSNFPNITGKYKSVFRFFRCFLRAGDWETMFTASVNTMRAWSLFVATQYVSAPPSPSPTSMYNPSALMSVDLPFLRPTRMNTSLHLRRPVSLWTNP